MSRDPVDVIESEPESSNPYQFVYNNPLIYSDPTGMFSIGELKAAQKIQKTLENIYRKNVGNVSRWAIDEAKGVATDIFTSTLNSLTPAYFEDFWNLDPNFTPPNITVQQGFALEALVQKAICGVMSSTFSQYRDNVWFEVGVDKNGNPRNNGTHRCNSNGEPYSITNRKKSNKYNHPDFIFKKGQPYQQDRRPPAYLIGDFKRQVTTIKEDRNQWKAIMNYARSVADVDPKKGPGHQYVPVALYITFFGRSKANRTHEAKLKRKAAKDHRVALQIISLF